MLRVYIYDTPAGIIVSDGGFAAKQLEMLSSNTPSRQSYRRLQRLASDHDLYWEGGRLYFMEPTLEAALYRLDRFALALNDAELMLHRGVRPRLETREYLRRGLESRYGITTRPDYKIVLPLIEQDVTVDIYAQREGRRAVIEIIEARTEAALRNQVDRSTTNLTLLVRGNFDGALIGVYDEEVLKKDRGALERFRQAKPEQAILIPREQALERVSMLLHAA